MDASRGDKVDEFREELFAWARTELHCARLRELPGENQWF